MPPTISKAVEQYIAAMRTAHSFGAHTAETTYYTPLSNLLNTVGEALKPRVVFVAHPGNRGAGLPDGGLFPVTNRRQTEPQPNQRPERGAVEIKAPGESLAVLAQSEQVRRYLGEYGLCLITNYHQFQLVELRQGRPSVMENYDLTRTADDLWNLIITDLAKRHAETLPDFLARVLTRKVPLEKPKDVAELLASYAREARERAVDHPLAAFEGVKSALQESLGITFEGEKGEHFFRSTLIQTLFYGIFSAWILWRRSPDYGAHNGIFNWRLSAEYLRVAVLRTLFHALAEPGALESANLPEVLDHATEALNRVQPDFFTTFREEDAVQYFYEPFLEAFDPELRKELGVWYTPREIVRYMVERVDHLLRTELNEPLGLASRNVQVLDPCCGTGAYLVEVLHRIERTLREQAGDDDALVGAELRRAVTTRIFGFEIMPAPFVISHLQIAQLLEDARASLAATQRAQVFLTNALTGWVPIEHPKTLPGFPEFAKERDAAEAVKQADTILVILGNPPYNGYAGIAKIEEERDLTLAYRTSIPGLAAPQGQGLNDLYIRFFRIAERRIVGDAHAKGNRNGRGIMSFISNNAWLDGLSHVSMRSHYLSEFQHIYIDNLNGDKYRTGKTTPDGKPDPSAFSTSQNREGIQVGTAISTLVRTSATSNSDKIQLRNLWGTEKLSRLNQEAMPEVELVYDAVNPVAALGLPFAARVHSAAYTTWPRLTELFQTSAPGVKTSRDTLVTDIDVESLERRLRAYLNSAISNEEFDHMVDGAMKDVGNYKAASVRNFLQNRSILRYQDEVTNEIRSQLKESSFRPWQLRRFTYRPFDTRWIYWEPETNLIDRKREELMIDVAQDRERRISNLFLEARQRENSDRFCRGSIASSLPDNFGSGLSTFFPLFSLTQVRKRLEMGGMGEMRETYVANQSVEAMNYVFRTVGHGQSTFPIDTFGPDTFVFFHALATMHTPQYRTENSGALLGDWPRIPLPATAELLTHSATLGRRLAELLDPESDLNLAAEWSLLGRLSIAAEFPEGTPDRDRRNAARFALNSDWGRNQKGKVMPGNGKAPERDWTPVELDRLAALAAAQNLTLDDALTLLGPRCVDVYLNDAAFWAAVPTNVWEYTLGGYQVLKKWLSYREEPLLGRPLHEDEARYFAQVVRRIAAILFLGPALDASYAAILPNATGLPS